MIPRRTKAERALIDAAKAWRAAHESTEPTHDALLDGYARLAKAVDALVAIETSGPTTLDEMSCRAQNGFYNAGLESLEQLFREGRTGMWRKKNVGTVALGEYESVLRANGFDGDDWRAR